MSNAAHDESPRGLPSDIIRTHLFETGRKSFQENQWGRRHVQAWLGQLGAHTADAKQKRAQEAAIRDSIVAWAALGEQHFLRYDSHMGDDGVLGVAWKAIGQGLVGLLNGELGAFDGGTLDALIRNIAAACGVNLEE